ncbi:MAG TPA: carbohydrate ABC transporter permease [Chloroflexota bacterium]|jgi:multiple sugar transport system permease protein|nr:carbohydrate ABC transporter permease [Chloroflexota bacterium]
MAASSLALDQSRPRARRTPLEVALSVVKHAVLLAFGLTFLLPFWWMVATSLKPDQAMFHIPPLLVPWQDPDTWNELVFSNYPRAFTFTRPPFTVFIWNTIVIAALSVGGALFSNPLAAYGLSRVRWPGRGLLFGVTLSTLFLPVFVTLIPLFLIYRRLGWIGTPLPLIVPTYFGNPLFIFLLRQFFMTIPQELSEAARIDGASELRIYWNVILPLAKPALATIALFEFLQAWRDFFGPLLFLIRKETYTISLGLNFYRFEYETAWGLMMAMSVCVTLPIIILFFFVQRTFIQGITLTGIKG